MLTINGLLQKESVNTTVNDTGLISTLPFQTSVSTSVSGGVFNGGFENAPAFTAATSTASKYIDGTATGSATDTGYGWYLYAGGTSYNAQFDNTVAHSGIGSFKINSINIASFNGVYAMYGGTAAGGSNTSNNAKIPCKGNTLYKFGIFIKTSAITSANSKGVKVFVREMSATDTELNNSFLISPYYTGTQDWTLWTTTGTTQATTAYFQIGLSIQGETGIAWFDDITLEEVQTSTVAVKEPTYISEIIQGVTSTTSIDQIQTTQDGNYYAGDLSGTDYQFAQSFTPTKKYLSGVNIIKYNAVGTPTGNLVFGIYADNAGKPTGSLLTSFSYTLAAWNALATDGAEVTVPLYCILTPGSLYWIRTYDTVANEAPNNYYILRRRTSGGAGTLNYSTDTGGTWAAIAGHQAYFKTLYAKPTEGTTLTSNGVSTVLRSDGDGILNGAVIDVDNGKYSYKFNPIYLTAAQIVNDLYSLSAGGYTTPSSTISVVGNGWNLAPTNFASNNGATDRYYTFKVNTILPIKHMVISLATLGGATRNYSIRGSLDNNTWTTILSIPTDTDTVFFADTDMFNGNNIAYVQIYKPAAINDYVNTRGVTIQADLDTSSVVLPRFYPINTTLQRSINWIAPGTVLSYVYRQNKYTNGSGIVMPTWELNSAADGTGTSLGQIVCDFDNSGETTPSGRVMSGSTGVASTTNGLTDGQYVALGAGATSGVLTYQLGGGTTTFINPTKNRFYLSSNGSAIASDRDPSLQAGITYGIRTQGLAEDITLDRKKLVAMQNKPLKKTVRITVPVGTTTVRETYGATHLIIGVPSTASAVTVDLDCSLLTKVKQVKIVDESGAANVNNITISTSGPCKINGADTQVINTAGGSLTLYTSGTAWFIR